MPPESKPESDPVTPPLTPPVFVALLPVALESEPEPPPGLPVVFPEPEPDPAPTTEPEPLLVDPSSVLEAGVAPLPPQDATHAATTSTAVAVALGEGPVEQHSVGRERKVLASIIASPHPLGRSCTIRGPSDRPLCGGEPP